MYAWHKFVKIIKGLDKESIKCYEGLIRQLKEEVIFLLAFNSNISEWFCM